MRAYGWLFAFSSLLATGHAWPELPHFELDQTSIANTVVVPRYIKGTCKRIAALTNLSDMAANQTLLNELLSEKKISQPQIDDIMKRKDDINAELQTLNSNATLAAECGAVNAHRQAVKDCKRMNKLEQLTELATNKTAYDEHLAGELLNQKQIEQLKKNMETAEIKLQEMRRNSTLIELCTTGIALQQNGAANQHGNIGEGAYFAYSALT